MAPELRLVKGELGDDPSNTVRFGPDRMVPVRIAQLSAVMAILAAFAGLVIAQNTGQRAACWGWCGLQSVLFLWAASSAVGRASIRYTLGAQRLETERGLFARRRESLELFRVRDVVLEQGFIQRLRGLGNITLYSTDQVEPTLVLQSIGGAQAIYEQLRDTASRARQQRVVQVDG